MFGVGSYIGRVFTPDDDRAGADPVVVMSYRTWNQKYGVGSLGRRQELHVQWSGDALHPWAEAETVLGRREGTRIADKGVVRSPDSRQPKLVAGGTMLLLGIVNVNSAEIAVQLDAEASDPSKVWLDGRFAPTGGPHLALRRRKLLPLSRNALERRAISGSSCLR